MEDAGVIVRRDNKNKYTSSWLVAKASAPTIGEGFTVSRSLWAFRDNHLTPFKFILLRIFQLTAGRSEAVGLAVKNYLRDRTISKSKEGPFDFERALKITTTGIHICDRVGVSGRCQEIIVGSKLSFIYGASARYFQVADLQSPYFRFAPPLDGEFCLTRLYGKGGDLEEIHAA